MRLRASASQPADGPVFERTSSRRAAVGGGDVRRALPRAGRRTVGPWCFLDTYGPTPVNGPAQDMQVGPHPHTGLQTVTWLLQGEMEHRDSVGSVQRIRPGQLNWMTAGSGIVHAELAQSGPIEGAQLWVALPDAHRGVDPAFHHFADLPVLQDLGGSATVLAGRFGHEASPAPEFHPLVGAEVRGRIALPLDPLHETAFLALRGDAVVEGESVGAHELVYLGRGREAVELETEVGLLIGGAPLEEPILLWWNFVERTHEEVVASRARWESGGIGVVAHTPGRIPAPPLGG